MLARLSAFLVWALVAATASFWGLRLLAHAPEAPPFTVAAGDAGTVHGDLTRLLGAPPVVAAPVAVVPEASSRFRLVGVMAPPRTATAGSAGHGVALIAVDGKPPRAFSVGARLDNELVLQSVSLRGASIGPAQGAASAKLELPPLLPPATGTLPPGGRSTSVPTYSAPVIPPMPSPPPQPARDLGTQTE